MKAWADDILHFWFDHVGPAHWFAPRPQLDAEIRERFCPLWEELRTEQAMFFLGGPRQALASVILFDQFPRNMFREEAQAYATDPLALSIAREAIDMGHDEQLPAERKAFLYMPFMHSEDIEDQDRSVALFRRAGLMDNLRFAEEHRELIRRFGRFPHRNPVLGRESSAAELQAIEDWHS